MELCLLSLRVDRRRIRRGEVCAVQPNVSVLSRSTVQPIPVLQPSSVISAWFFYHPMSSTPRSTVQPIPVLQPSSSIVPFILCKPVRYHFYGHRTGLGGMASKQRDTAQKLSPVHQGGASHASAHGCSEAGAAPFHDGVALGADQGPSSGHQNVARLSSPS